MTANSEMIENNFNKIAKQGYGTRFFRTDLHFHTPASSDARGRNKYGFNPYGMTFPKNASVLKGLKDLAGLQHLKILEGLALNALEALELKIMMDMKTLNDIVLFRKDSGNPLYQAMVGEDLKALRAIRDIPELSGLDEEEFKALEALLEMPEIGLLLKNKSGDITTRTNIPFLTNLDKHESKLFEVSVVKDFKEIGSKFPDFKEAGTMRDFQDQILAYASAKADQIIDTFIKKGLHLVAVTDHNGFGTIWDDKQGVMDLTAPTWYELIDDAADKANNEKDANLTVLPGVELSVNGVHILAIFPRHRPRRAVHFKICELLNDINIPLESWCQNDAVSPTSSYDAIDLIHKRGGLAIPAHIDGLDQGLLYSKYDLTAGALKNVVANENLQVVEIINSFKFREVEIKRQETEKKPSLKTQMEKIRAEKMLSSLSYIQGSDSHDLVDVAKRYTYFKMTEPSFAGLLTAIKMPSSRVRIADSEKEWNGLYIRGLVFENHPLLGTQAVRFNRNLNCICGKLGVGKTTLFQLMQSVVKLDDPSDPQIAEERPLQGFASMFVDRMDQDDQKAWDKSVTLTQYAYSRDAGERQASIHALDEGGKPDEADLGLKDTIQLGLQLKFYNPERMKQNISDTQAGTEAEPKGPFQGFLCKLVGDPSDKASDDKVKEFNELFYMPKFLDGGGTREDLLQNIEALDNQLRILDPKSSEARKIKAEKAKEENKLDTNQLLLLTLNNGVYQLEMNLAWRTDKAMTNFFDLNESQRKTAMICMILVKGEVPVIIDAPEEEFDNRDMANYLVPVILDCKDTRQILLFTNNPILAVNTDPDNYILIQRMGKNLNIDSGFSIDAPQEKKEMLLEILEGDLSTFRKRASRYEL